MKLTREDLRLLAAGQVTLTSGYQPAKEKTLAFIEGAVWAFDFLTKQQQHQQPQQKGVDCDELNKSSRQ